MSCVCLCASLDAFLIMLQFSFMDYKTWSCYSGGCDGGGEAMVVVVKFCKERSLTACVLDISFMISQITLSNYFFFSLRNGLN